MIISLIMAAIVVALDQFTKIKSAELLPAIGQYKLWDGVLHFTYVENRGAAFGMLQGAKWFFLALTLVACVLIVWFMVKERKRMPKLMMLSLALILAGAIGNFIDRAVLGYVRDMIYVAIINFAVFNVADMAVCIGCGLLFIDAFFLSGKRFLDELDKKKPDEAESK